MEHLEMIHSELEDLSLLQLGGSLFLESGWNESPQLGEAVIDPIPPSLLDDSSPSLSCHVATSSAVR